MNETTRPARKRRERPWNRCDDCGKFIPMSHFEVGMATRKLVSLDTAFSSESYETLCHEHAAWNKGAE